MHTNPLLPSPEKSKRHLSRKETLAIHNLQDEYTNLLNSLSRVQTELDVAHNNFNYLEDKNAIDACIFQIQTSQSHYADLFLRLQDVKKRLENICDDTTKLM